MTMEEAWIQSASTTTSPASATALTMLDLAPATPASSSAMPTTHRPLPCYKRRQIDNTDLLDSIDRVSTKLAKTLALVSSIQSQPNEQVTMTHNRSTRPARASPLWFALSASTCAQAMLLTLRPQDKPGPYKPFRMTCRLNWYK